MVHQGHWVEQEQHEQRSERPEPLDGTVSQVTATVVTAGSVASASGLVAVPSARAALEVLMTLAKAAAQTV
jgi:hypothetical protein